MITKFTQMIVLAGLVIANSKNIDAEQVPVFKDFKVEAKVSFDYNLYTYSYQLSNSQTNSGEIENFQIDISRPEGGVYLSSEGLIIQRGINRKGKMLTSSFDERRSFIDLPPESVVPVGTQVPEGWSSGLSKKKTISWGVREKKYQTLPGRTSDQFVIISRGLPAIRDVSVRPDWILSVEGYVSEEDLGKSKKIEEEITLYGKTIAPTAPPADFSSAAFLDYIIDLKHQAVSLGWIKNKGAVTSLDAKLDNAKKKISEGQPGAARNILRAFISEVEAQGCATYKNCPSGKHLTSEAYALLKHNAQYLIDNLK